MAKFSDFLSAMGQARPVTEYLKTTQELDIGRQKMRLGEQLSDISGAQEVRAQQQFENKQLLFNQEQERGNQAVNINTHPMFGRFSEEGKKKITDSLFKRGDINKQGIGTLRDLENYVKEVETTSKLFEYHMLGEVESEENILTGILNERKEEQKKDKPNANAIKALDEKYSTQAAKVFTMRGEYEKAWKMIKGREDVAMGKIPATKTIDLPGGKMQREMGYNPQTGQYDIDIGSEPRPIFKPTEGVGGKQTALTANVKFLIDNGLADTKQEAYRMARELGTKSKRQFLMEARLKLEGNQYLRMDEVDERMVRIEEFYNKLVGGTPDKLADMPSVSENKGRTIRDTTTGKRYKSDGTDWVEIK